MKVLLDSCVSGHAAETIREAGLDAVWAGVWPSDPGGDQVLAVAAEESRVLVPQADDRPTARQV